MPITPLAGNLEMTLAARLATQANVGKLDDPKNQWSVAVGNIALIQGQAIVVAFLAALIAIAVNYFKEFHFDTSSTLLICATSLCTASITGLFLAALMVVITIVARRAGVSDRRANSGYELSLRSRTLSYVL